MGILRVDHHDIVEFITAKLDGTTLQNFNVPVGITNAFMDAVHKDQPYDLIHPCTGRSVGGRKAREVFSRIAASAWQTGDPGLVFLDAINRNNPTPHLGLIEATNPCGEIPLLPYESCTLGSINLSHMLTEHSGHPAINEVKLRTTANKAVRFLDDVITASMHPLPEIELMTQGNRKIVLGVMGFADMLIRFGVSYDSDEAVTVAEQVMQTVADEAFRMSRQLAEERGTFLNWKGSVYEATGVEIRNATRTAIAPTGTISIIADTSPSIEPLFALAYRRSHVLGDQTLCEVNPAIVKYLRSHNMDEEEVVGRIEEEGHIRDIKNIPDDVKRLFVTALDIPPERHLQIQAASQRHVDNSVSKTINLPSNATAQDVRQIYWRAWELGLKGVTIYRYGSKSKQVLELGTGEASYHYDHSSRCDPNECRI